MLFLLLLIVCGAAEVPTFINWFIGLHLPASFYFICLALFFVCKMHKALSVFHAVAIYNTVMLFYCYIIKNQQRSVKLKEFSYMIMQLVRCYAKEYDDVSNISSSSLVFIFIGLMSAHVLRWSKHIYNPSIDCTSFYLFGYFCIWYCYLCRMYITKL